MKATNNINQDLKEEIERLLQKCSKLQMHVDDTEKIIEDERKKMEADVTEKIDQKDKALQEAIDGKAKLNEELAKAKHEYQYKMEQVKLMEEELDEKLNKAAESADEPAEEAGSGLNNDLKSS